MGEDTLTSDPDTLTVPPAPPPLSPPPTSTIPPITLPVVSPTFTSIINKPIFSLFYSQSTDQEPSTTEEDELIEFAELEFDLEEDNVDDNIVMSGKQ